MKWKYSIYLFLVITMVSSLLIISSAGAQVRATHIGERLKQSPVPVKGSQDIPDKFEGEDLTLSKSAGYGDRGNLSITTGRYQNLYIYNYGQAGQLRPLGLVGYWGRTHNCYPMLGMPPGPWGADILTQKSPLPEDRTSYYNVLESFTYSWGKLYSQFSSNSVDWDARDGSYGRSMGVTYKESNGSNQVPAIARSTLTDTWPEGYYGTDPNVFTGMDKTWNETPGTKYWPGKWQQDPISGDPIPGMFASTVDGYFAMDDKRAGCYITDNITVSYPVGFDWEWMVYSYSSPLISNIVYNDADIIFQKADHVAEIDPSRRIYTGSVDSVYIGFISHNYIPYSTIISGTTYNAYPYRNDCYVYLDQTNNLLLTYHRWGIGLESTSSSSPLAALSIPSPIYGFYWAKTPHDLGITSMHYFNFNTDVDSYLMQGEQEERIFYGMLSGRDVMAPDEKATFGNRFFHPFPALDEKPNYALDNMDSLEIWMEYNLDTGQRYDPDVAWPPQSARDYGVNARNKPETSTMVGSGPFTFFPGDTVKIAWAYFFDDDNGINSPVDPLTGWPSNDPLRNPDLRPTRGSVNGRFYSTYHSLAIAKDLYVHHYLGTGPPISPTLTVNGTLVLDEYNYPIYLAEDGRITLYWDNIAEITPDFGTGIKDFEGYRLYRRYYDYRGASSTNTNTQWRVVGQWDLIDDVKGMDSLAIQKYLQGKTYASFTTLPPQSWDLGSNTGLAHTFRQTGLTNGLRYEYSLTAYDWPDKVNNVPSSESLIGSNPKFRGYVRVRPTYKPMGFVEGNIESDAQNIQFHHTSGYATAKLYYRVVDELLVGDKDYTLTFTDSLGKKYYKIFNNTDNIYQVGNKVLVYDSTASPAGTIYDYWPIFNGIGLYIYNYDALKYLNKRWAPITLADITARRSKIPPQQLYTLSFDALSTTVGGVTPKPMVLEFRYGGHTKTSDTTVVFDNTQLYAINTGYNSIGGYDTTLSMITKKKVTDPTKIVIFPFTMWNMSDSLKPYQMLITQQTAIENAPPYKLGEEISIVDTVNKTYVVRWRFRISSVTIGSYNYRTPRDSLGVVVYDSLFYTKKDSIDAYPVTGDKYRWYTTLPIVANQDVYTFHTQGYHVDPAKFQLWKIRAVPNPYVVASGLEAYSGTSDILNKEIRFVNLPDDCTIDIYTISGAKIRRLYHYSWIGDNSTAGGFNFKIKNQARYPSGVGEQRWDLLTDENLEVSYGVYIYVVKTFDGKNKFIGKLLIIK